MTFFVSSHGTELAAILQAAALQWFAPLETLLSVDTVRESFSPPRGAPLFSVRHLLAFQQLSLHEEGPVLIAVAVCNEQAFSGRTKLSTL